MRFLPWIAWIAGRCRLADRRLRAALAVSLLGLLTGSAEARIDPEMADPSTLKQLSIEELMEIDVTSVSKHSERLSAAAAAISVITGDEIRRSGVTSLPEALRLANSLHVARFDSRTWAISARGFNLGTANKMLVLIDGRSVYTQLFSGVFWDAQDTMIEDVDRIEVIRGPGATLWGANAVNGVINIITRRAGETQGGLAVVGGGAEDRGGGGVRYGGELAPGTHYRTYVKYQYLDSLTFANGTDARDPLRRGQGGFRLDRAVADGDSLTVQGDLYRGVIGQDVRADTDIGGGNLLGRWSRRLSERSDLTLQLYYDRTHRMVPGQFEEHRDTWDVELQQHTLVAGRHDLVWGVGYRITGDDVENSPVVTWDPDSETSDLLNVFAQDEIRVSDRLRITVGTKLEDNDFTGLELQPSVRFAWTPDDRRTLWGAVSRAVRSPTRIDRDAVFTSPQGTVLIRGSKDFESEDLLAYELGWRMQPRAELSVDLAAFYNVYDDLRSQELSPQGGFPIVLANKLEGEAWGVEVQTNYQSAPWWRWYFAYAFLEKDLRLEPGSRDFAGGAGEGNDPRHRLSLRSAIDLPRELELDLWLRWVDELPAPAVPAYTELDVRLGWSPTEDLELALVGRNLLDDRHPEFGAPSPRREEVDRGIYGQVTWRF